MRNLIALLLTLAVASETFALELIAPREGGLVMGDTVELELDTKTPPATILVDGKATAVQWRSLPYARRSIASVRLGSGTRHEVEVTSGSATVKARFQSVKSSVTPGELVARRALGVTRLEGRSWQWGPGVLTYGLSRFATVSSDRARIVSDLARYHTVHGARSPRIDYPDVCAPALSALSLVRDHGVAVGVPGARRVADYLRREPRNALGAIDHLGANGHLRKWANLVPVIRHWSHSIWVDSLVMYAVFSAQWGAATGDTALRDFGAEQPGIFASVLQDPFSGLLTHAWDVRHARPLGGRWLRGNGWVGVSIVEILDELPASHPRRAELVQVLVRLERGLGARQLENGLWDTLVDLPGAAYPESSGSALAAYALAKGARRGWLPASARDRARHAFAALTARLRATPDGLAVTGSSGSTNPSPDWGYALVGRRDDIDHGIGAYLLLATELSRDPW